MYKKTSIEHCHATTILVMSPYIYNSKCLYSLLKKEPDYLFFKPQFGYFDLNGRISRWPHTDKGLLLWKLTGSELTRNPGSHDALTISGTGWPTNWSPNLTLSKFPRHSEEFLDHLDTYSGSGSTGSDPGQIWPWSFEII